MDGCMDGWVDRWIDGCVWCVYIFIYIYIHMYIHIHIMSCSLRRPYRSRESSMSVGETGRVADQSR